MWRRFKARFQAHDARFKARLAWLRRAYRESERLRAELSHVEHEIYEIWESALTRREKVFLEQVLRVRTRRIENEMLRLQHEVYSSGYVLTEL
jgi:hypothetical protein